MTLHAQVWGRGEPTVVGLHGWNGTAETFLPLTPPRQGSLLAYDLPGFGRSTAPSKLDVEHIIGPILRDFEERDAKDLTLIGSCAGSVWAMELALAAPERVRRLILVDAFAYVPWYFQVLTLPLLGAFFYWVTFAQPFGRWIANVALASKRAEETDLTADFAEVEHRVAHGYLKILCASPQLRRYAPLARCDIDLVVGAQSFSAVHRSAHLFQQLWPQARRHVLEGAGHLPIEEAPAQLADILYGRTLALEASA